MRSSGTLSQEPKLRPITGRICQWLNGLDRQTISWGNVGTIDVQVDHEYGDWVLTLEAVPRSGGDSVIVGCESEGRSGIIGEEIYKAVSKKARKYKNLDHPLVVAVNIPSAGAEPHEEAALFGHPTLRLRRSEDGDDLTPAGIIHTGKALWFDNTKRRSRYPKLSALMMFHDLAPWTVANVSACLYLNPYVNDRVPRELRALGYAAEADGQLRRYKGSRLVRNVLGLPEDWPGSFGLGD